MVKSIVHGLEDEQEKICIITALTISELAAAAPHGTELFYLVYKPLWAGVNKYHGKELVAFLKVVHRIYGPTYVWNMG